MLIYFGAAVIVSFVFVVGMYMGWSRAQHETCVVVVAVTRRVRKDLEPRTTPIHGATSDTEDRIVQERVILDVLDRIDEEATVAFHG